MVKSVSAYGSGFVYSTFCVPPYVWKGAGNQILDRLFTDHATQQNEFPARMSREGTYAVADYPDSQSVLDKLSGYEKKWTEYVDINKVPHSSLSHSQEDAQIQSLEDLTIILQ